MIPMRRARILFALADLGFPGRDDDTTDALLGQLRHEADWAHEWDDEESARYVDRVEGPLASPPSDR